MGFSLAFLDNLCPCSVARNPLRYFIGREAACQRGERTVHEMARDEARHGKALKGLLERYFK